MEKDAHKKSDVAYPMRINKYLALKNYSTRRGADELIGRGLVSINGHKAKLGDKVGETDTVEIKGSGPKKKYVYFAYNKPRGIITHSPQEGEEDIRGAVAHAPELRGTFPVGRLDKDSYGLIILTNDGRVTDRLLNPKFDHDKEYEVTAQSALRPSFKEHMEQGVDIGGYTTKDCKVRIVSTTKFLITLSEGKKHQIRRMVAALHNTVTGLKRIRVLNIKLENIPEGEWRAIEGAELKTFLQKLGLE